MIITNPVRIDAIVVSTQHDDFDTEAKMQDKISKDMINILIPRVKAKYKKYANLFNDKIKYHINPTGKFVIGGPHGDTGLTGRKIIVDTYGGKGAHGGGAFSGKDPSKVDRSAAYATRHIAKNLVAAGVCEEVLVQVSYAIGVAQPMGILCKYLWYCQSGTDRWRNCSKAGRDLRYASLLHRATPETAQSYLQRNRCLWPYGPQAGDREKDICISRRKGSTREVELFTWEKLDYVAKIKKAFNLK